MNFLQTLTLALPQVYTKFAFPTLGKITRSLLLNLTHERGNNPPRQNRKKKGKNPINQEKNEKHQNCMVVASNSPGWCAPSGKKKIPFSSAF